MARIEGLEARATEEVDGSDRGNPSLHSNGGPNGSDSIWPSRDETTQLRVQVASLTMQLASIEEQLKRIQPGRRVS